LEPVNLLKLDFCIDELFDLDHTHFKFNFQIFKNSEELENCPLFQNAELEFIQVLDEEDLIRGNQEESFRNLIEEKHKTMV
jgi:hypothetical protein